MENQAPKQNQSVPVASAKNRILTKEKLCKRRWQGLSSCEFCGKVFNGKMLADPSNAVFFVLFLVGYLGYTAEKEGKKNSGARKLANPKDGK